MQTAADPDELETGSDSAGYTSDSDTSCSDGEGVRERGCGSPAADELCDSSDDNGFSDEDQPAESKRRERKYNAADIRAGLRFILTTLEVSGRNVGAEAAALAMNLPTMAWTVRACTRTPVPSLPTLTSPSSSRAPPLARGEGGSHLTYPVLHLSASLASQVSFTKWPPTFGDRR